MSEGKDIDSSSFASILAGVQKMRDSYEPVVPGKRPIERDLEPKTPSESTSNDSKYNSQARSIPTTVRSSSTSISGNRSTLTSHSASVVSNEISRPPEQTSNSRSHDRSGHHRRQGVQTYTSVQVANSQKGNPLLESPLMKQTPWTYNGQILSDYYINATLQVLFLSLKYHKLRPEYVWRRIEKLKGGSVTGGDSLVSDQALRVLLVVVDIDSPQEAIRHLLGICMKQDLSMVVAWSFEEAGNYLAYFKQNELATSKIASSIQGVKKGDYNLNIVSTLTSVRAVNKTDVAHLLANCKSFKNVVLQAALGDGLGDIPGLGDRKIQNLKAVFSEPFVFNKDYQDT
ncbi:CIC11C00000005761 [Sungouiella intermedia]|uniref:CIC11C00000005761 n=1 Tax=Sungouiella intermedia TaxID=45354 RepID=A0A1L0BCL7_9ASCO|nr:CIC11C00000005761 [[Candida] intermedia]